MTYTVFGGTLNHTLPTCYKLLVRLALQRISPTVEGILSQDQAGFWKERSTCEQVAALTSYI